MCALTNIFYEAHMQSCNVQFRLSNYSLFSTHTHTAIERRDMIHITLNAVTGIQASGAVVSVNN